MKSILFLFTGLTVLFLLGCRGREDQSKTGDFNTNYLRLSGVAFLNQDKLDEAESAFKQLLDKVPGDAAGHANLALVYLKQGKYKEAQEHIQKALKRDDGNPDIGMIASKYYELTQEPTKAIEILNKIIDKNPDDTRALYNLSRLYAQTGNDQDSTGRQEKFLKATIEKAGGNMVPRLDLIALYFRQGRYNDATAQLEALPKIFPEFPKEAKGYYSRTMDALHQADTVSAGSKAMMFENFIKATSTYQNDLLALKSPGGDLAGLSVFNMGDNNIIFAEPGESTLERIRFLDVTSAMRLIPEPNDENGTGSPKATSNCFALGDFDQDGYIDLYFNTYDSLSKTGIVRLWKNYFGSTFQDLTNESGMQTAGHATSARFGDFDNDGYLDLFVVRDGQDALYKNDSKNHFTDIASKAGVANPNSGHDAVFLDADHDGDLDLLLSEPGENKLYRNNGDETFADMTTAMGLESTGGQDAAFADFDEDGDLDIVVAGNPSSTILFSNERHGKFTDITSTCGLKNAGPAVAVKAADFDNDGFTDILLLSPGAGQIKLYRNLGDGTFESNATPWLKSARNLMAQDAQFFDFDNDGWQDILITGEPTVRNDRGVFLFHNDSIGHFTDVSDLLPSGIPGGHQVGVADVDKDGDLDVFIADMKTGLHLLQNEGGNLNHFMNVRLTGLRNGNSKNNYFGIGSKIEVRAGNRYQMQVVTDPVIHFGLGSNERADVIRITWTNGVTQNNFFPVTEEGLLESQVLKGSCAFLYTWNGQQFTFLKDMMWRSALGMPLGIMGSNTAYAPADASKEFLKIPGEEMQLKDGKYVLQVTEELWEAAYFDRLEMVAVDHPGDEEIYVDETFTLPPYTDQYDLYSVSNKISPVSAVDQLGTNVLPLILKKDDQYISNFQLDDYQGMAELHTLTLDPGPDLPKGDLVLYLNGWIFPSDASINVALGQSQKLKVISPQLQVMNKSGAWVAVIPNMGFPMGKDKTMIVDLSHKFLSGDHRVRIITNMEIYWDAIFFAAKSKPRSVLATPMKPGMADLHYRGFSNLFRKGGRYGPQWFDYTDVSTGQKWRDLTGSYTRYGDVTPLLLKSDDQLVIMNSGDEMTVSFDAGKLPGLKPGWKRDFLIYSEGWIKDGDLNTAHSMTVGPLPFHAMKRYPYDDIQQYPADEFHQAYLRDYNTRQVNTSEFRREFSKK